MVVQPRLMPRGEPLTKEAWEAIMDAAEKGATSAANYGIEGADRTENSITISFMLMTYVDTRAQKGFDTMYMPVFNLLSTYADCVSKVSMPNLEYVPKNGLPSKRELAIGLFGDGQISAWDYNNDLASLVWDTTIEITDGANTVYTIAYKAD